jgi:hypothetical protein
MAKAMGPEAWVSVKTAGHLGGSVKMARYSEKGLVVCEWKEAEGRLLCTRGDRMPVLWLW